jgi:hypothetical protein
MLGQPNAEVNRRTVSPDGVDDEALPGLVKSRALNQPQARKLSAATRPPSNARAEE